MEGILEKAKVAFKENKVEVIMGVCIVIPMLLVSLIFSGVDSILLGILVVPIAYRIIANIVLRIMNLKGMQKNVFVFNTTTRVAIFVAFLIVYIFGMIFGLVDMGIIELILVCLFVAFFDKIFLGVLHVFCGSFLNIELGSTDRNVARTVEDEHGHSVMYNSKGEVIGTGQKDKYGHEVYRDEKGNHIGNSVENKNGDKVFYDEKGNFAGGSRKYDKDTDVYYDDKLNSNGVSKKTGNGSKTFLNNN